MRTVACLIALVFVAPVFPEDGLGSSLRQHYQEFNQARISGENPLPFSLDSLNNVSDSRASIRYFLDDVEFDVFTRSMTSPEEWCEFIPLHLNIKACAYLERNGNQQLLFYAGIKGYITPEDAQLLQLKFNTAFEDGVFLVKLFAQDGPLDSANINFDIRAIPINDGDKQGVYLEFDLSSEPGLAASLMRVYLATIARKKVGFSIGGKDWRGNDELVRGPRGATERNIVRYLLAIETYFATMDVPPEQRFMERLENWFDATEQFRRQLYELPRKEYIANKIKERFNQEILQTAIDNNMQPVYKKVERQR